MSLLKVGKSFVREDDPCTDPRHSEMIVQRLALPLHVQRLERVLDVKPYLSHVEGIWRRDGEGRKEGERGLTLIEPSISKK